MEGVKRKFDGLQDLNKLSDKFSDLKKNLSNNDKPQDQYSAEDLRKRVLSLFSVDQLVETTQGLLSDLNH